MNGNEIYKSPDSELEQPEANFAKKYGAWRRFYITFLFAFPIFMAIIIGTTPKEAWFLGGIGSATFSIFSGLIALLIPVQRKAVFVSAGVILGVLTAAVIGNSLSP